MDVCIRTEVYYTKAAYDSLCLAHTNSSSGRNSLSLVLSYGVGKMVTVVTKAQTLTEIS